MISLSTYIETESQRVYRLKIKSEQTFTPEVRSYFAKVSRSLGDPQSSLSLVEGQYERIVRRYFSPGFKEFTRKDLEAAILADLANRAQKDADLIDSTTEKQIQQAIDAAREELGPGATNAAILLVAGRIFKQLSAGRVGNIATTETQAATEKTRNDIAEETHKQMGEAIESGDKQEAQRLADMSGDYASLKAADSVGKKDPTAIMMSLALASKRWQSMDDELVRPWHATANGQTVLISEPFIVDGEKLMFPGDGSMGASARNLCHCRCISLII